MSLFNWGYANESEEKKGLDKICDLVSSRCSEFCKDYAAINDYDSFVRSLDVKCKNVASVFYSNSNREALTFQPMSYYETLADKIEEDEEERYYYLPSSYVFHDSELIEEYIDEIKNENIQEELEDAFYGKGKYRRFKETLRKFRIENDYYNFREEYLKNMAIEWCQKNNIEYEE